MTPGDVMKRSEIATLRGLALLAVAAPWLGACDGTTDDGAADGGAAGVGEATAAFCNSMSRGDSDVRLRLTLGEQALDAPTADCSPCSPVPAGPYVPFTLDDPEQGRELGAGAIVLEPGREYVLVTGLDLTTGEATVQAGLLPSEQSCDDARESAFGQSGPPTGGTGGAGGGEGGGGGSDGSDGTPVPADPCKACLDEQCAAEGARCSGNPDCGPLLACLTACSSESCFDDCFNRYPGGVGDLGDLLHCMNDDCGGACGS